MVVVALIPHQLWRHVGWRPDDGGREGRALEDAGDAEVADADPPPALAQEDVGALQVAVYDTLIMQVFQARKSLPRPAEDYGLWDGPLGRLRLGDHAPEVSVLCEGHDHEKQLSLLHKAIAEGDEVWMCREALQEADLLLRTGAALGFQAGERDDLGHVCVRGVFSLLYAEDRCVACTLQHLDHLETPLPQLLNQDARVLSLRHFGAVEDQKGGLQETGKSR
mmetsp:Transcript_32126/g.92357  ORF Transcript_32126/g.92357 Transcript_32126/m.92357 type:complete len:222 (-) Transcript_32126:44-709(-)